MVHGYVFSHDVFPLCILSWIQFHLAMEVWIHILLSMAIPLVINFLDPQCIGQHSCSELVCTEHGSSYLEHDAYILFDVFLQLPTSYSFPNTSLYFYKSISVINFSFDLITWGSFVTHLFVTLLSVTFECLIFYIFKCHICHIEKCHIHLKYLHQ